EADIVVLNLKSTPIIQQRVERAESLRDILFAQMILADDRAIRAVYTSGNRIKAKQKITNGRDREQAR
ncbi:MAG: hypothetical protein VX007_10070, partial [Pseudomonadota bacterium]|nr:hypothetical protein [Pseudomonadota bacterium]